MSLNMAKIRESKISQWYLFDQWPVQLGIKIHAFLTGLSQKEVKLITFWLLAFWSRVWTTLMIIFKIPMFYCCFFKAGGFNELFDSINVWARKSGAASKVRSSLPCINLGVSISGSRASFALLNLKFSFFFLQLRPTGQMSNFSRDEPNLGS